MAGRQAGRRDVGRGAGRWRCDMSAWRQTGHETLARDDGGRWRPVGTNDGGDGGAAAGPDEPAD